MQSQRIFFRCNTHRNMEIKWNSLWIDDNSAKNIKTKKTHEKFMTTILTTHGNFKRNASMLFVKAFCRMITF